MQIVMTMVPMLNSSYRHQKQINKPIIISFPGGSFTFYPVPRGASGVKAAMCDAVPYCAVPYCTVPAVLEPM